MQNEILFKAENLSIGYSQKKKQQVIASGVNFNLETGKLIALIGENGIGKSTLLRTIAGIQKPLSGSILLKNKPIHEYNPLALAQKMSLVLTEKLPPSNLTVFELIALGRQPYTNWIGKLRESDFSIINRAMVLTKVCHLSEKKHYEISDGQLQKVLIARALAQDTSLIILDEPTTHLDLSHKMQLFILLKKLSQQTGKCVLFSTHDIDLAIEFSDEMIAMTKEKVSYGKPETLIEEGVLDCLFTDKNIIFDKEKGKFIFKSL